MNKLQHLLLKLSEECNEVGQIASKCMQFGLLERHPDLTENNKQRLHAELNDLFAIIEMLNLHFDLGFKPDQKVIAAKIDKVLKYQKYSIDLGLVTDAVPYEQWIDLTKLAPDAEPENIKSGSYWNLFCRDDFVGNWVEFEWDKAHQRNWIRVYRNGVLFFYDLLDSFRFEKDENQEGTCTLLVNERNQCLIVYGIPLTEEASLLEMMTATPLLKIENIQIEQVVMP